MRISDWSSDVCSSDLVCKIEPGCFLVNIEKTYQERKVMKRSRRKQVKTTKKNNGKEFYKEIGSIGGKKDRKSVVKGKSVSVRVDLGGRRIIKKKTKTGITKRHTRKITNIPKIY